MNVGLRPCAACVTSTVTSRSPNVRDQYFMLLIDKDASLAAIPSMLPSDTQMRSKAFDLIKEVMAALGTPSPEDEKRLRQIERLFGIGDEGAMIPFPHGRRELQTIAS
jgi:hypothetical protein